MSPKEEIEKLKEEAHKHLCEAESAGQEMFRLLERRMEATISRAASLGGKFVRDRVEDAYKLHSKTCCSTEETHDGAGCLEAASQALSELEKNLL